MAVYSFFLMFCPLISDKPVPMKLTLEFQQPQRTTS